LTSISNSFTIFLVSKGISNNLMKIGAKRRRTQEEIRTEKAQEALRLMTIETKMRQFEEMKQELDAMRAMKDQYDQVNDVVKPALI